MFIAIKISWLLALVSDRNYACSTVCTKSGYISVIGMELKALILYPVQVSCKLQSNCVPEQSFFLFFGVSDVVSWLTFYSMKVSPLIPFKFIWRDGAHILRHCASRNILAWVNADDRSTLRSMFTRNCKQNPCGWYKVGQGGPRPPLWSGQLETTFLTRHLYPCVTPVPKPIRPRIGGFWYI